MEDKDDGLKYNFGNIKGRYFKWLCDLVNISDEHASYYILADILHKRDFYGFVPNDDNRAEDGKKLRELFANELYESSDLNDGYLFEDLFLEKILLSLSGPCSVLEMMVALSKRIYDDILEDSEFEYVAGSSVPYPYFFFWVMLKNLGLDSLSDDEFYMVNGNDICEKTLDAMLSRKYGKDGTGGLFPLKHPKENQRKVEIWYQMAAFLEENFDILM